MYANLFYANPNCGYVSISERGRPSPAYTVARVAKEYLATGGTLTLPAGYDEDALDRLCWALGFYDMQAAVDHRQAAGLAQIAAGLLAKNEAFSFLSVHQKSAAQYVLETVARQTAEPES